VSHHRNIYSLENKSAPFSVRPLFGLEVCGGELEDGIRGVAASCFSCHIVPFSMLKGAENVMIEGLKLVPFAPDLVYSFGDFQIS